MSEPVYQSDPEAAPDSEYVRGELRHVVAGNRGRLLDPRRTPVRITRVLPETGFFELEIEAFEDAGARWLVPLEAVAGYQFAAEGAVADETAVARLTDAIARCDVQLTVTGGEDALRRTLGRLRAETTRAAEWLSAHGAPEHFDPQPMIEDRSGWPDAFAWLSNYMAARELGEMEERLAVAYVSNPGVGEVVLGHMVVLAELGLGTLTATAPRDPATFGGRWTRRHRTNHVLARMGFVRALWSRADGDVMLYRGMARQDDGEPPADARSRARRWPLVSASFSLAVGESHFGSTTTSAGALYRQRLQPGSLFMTFLETEAMNRQYREAEAVLLAGTGPFF